VYAVTAAQMQAMDKETIETIGLPGLILMEHAGTLTAAAAASWLEEQGGQRVVVLCGSGNNGGDGFVTARHLRNAGYDVDVFLAGHPTDLAGDARTHMEVWANLGGNVFPASEITGKRLAQEIDGADLVIDALLGTGLSKPLKGNIGAWVAKVNQSGRAVLAVDLPTGVNADTGQVMGSAVRADLTVTFGAPKLGHFLGEGGALTGKLVVADIGIPEDVVVKHAGNVRLITPQIASLWLPDRPADSHKGSFGHVLVAGGSTGMTGAVALAATGALCTGAGLVTAAIPERHNPVMEKKLTEAMTLPLPETATGGLSAAALEPLVEASMERSVTVFGPGLGQAEEAFTLARAFVRQVDGPLVLDADGLNAWVGHLEGFPTRPVPTVVTPHPGELARLLDTTVAEVQEDRIHSARNLASKLEAVVVLKGAHTVIADPFGGIWINSSGGPALASGGTGDVLAGMIGALLAQGMGAAEAACLGVYLHGLTADLWTEKRFPAGLAASVLARRVPRSMARLADGDVPEPVLTVSPMG